MRIRWGRTQARSGWLLAVALIAGCGDDATPKPGIGGADKTAKTVDGTRAERLELASGAALAIPKGAVTQSVQITIEQVPTAQASLFEKRFAYPETIASLPVLLTPHGQQFHKPIRLSVPVLAKHRERELDAYYLEDEADQHWKLLGSADSDGAVASIELDHFSIVVLADHASESSSSDAGNEPGVDAAVAPDTKDAGTKQDAAAADSGTADTGPVPSDSGLNDAGSTSAARVGFKLIVLDAQTATRLSDVEVVVLDNATGAALEPPSHGKTDMNGIVMLQVPGSARFALKGLARDQNVVDTYEFHISAAERPTGSSLYLASVTRDKSDAEHGGYSMNPGAAPLRGSVMWRPADDQISQALGCITIRGDGVEDFRAIGMDRSSPLPPSERAPELGTLPGNGTYVVGNLAPGPHVLSATLPDGTVVATATVVGFPRSGSTRNQGNQIVLHFEIFGAKGEDNPTPVACSQ